MRLIKTNHNIAEQLFLYKLINGLADGGISLLSLRIPAGNTLLSCNTDDKGTLPISRRFKAANGTCQKIDLFNVIICKFKRELHAYM